jgi:hypothetical protein
MKWTILILLILLIFSGWAYVEVFYADCTESGGLPERPKFWLECIDDN